MEETRRDWRKINLISHLIFKFTVNVFIACYVTFLNNKLLCCLFFILFSSLFVKKIRTIQSNLLLKSSMNRKLLLKVAFFKTNCLEVAFFKVPHIMDGSSKGPVAVGAQAPPEL